MSLKGLHKNWGNGSYETVRDEEIKLSENAELLGGDLSKLAPYVDGSIAIGYGFDLLVRSNAEINAYLTAAGLPALSTADANLLNQARALRNSGSANKNSLDPIVKQLSLNLGSEPNATAILDRYISQRAEVDLNNYLTTLGITLPQSRESGTCFPCI